MSHPVFAESVIHGSSLLHLDLYALASLFVFQPVWLFNQYDIQYILQTHCVALFCLRSFAIILFLISKLLCMSVFFPTLSMKSTQALAVPY